MSTGKRRLRSSTFSFTCLPLILTPMWHRSRKKRHNRSAKASVIESEVPRFKSIILADYYAELSNYYRTCEMQTKAWLVNNVGLDWVSIDVGSHIGYHGILMAQLAPEGKCYAFEPTDSFEKLVTNIKANSAVNIEAIQLGVSESTVMREDSIFMNWGAPAITRSWGFTSLDDFVSERELERVDLIKIDTDGYELEVLRGAHETLSRFQPKLIIEINHALATRDVSSSDIFEFVLDHRYDNCVILDRENYLFTSNWRLGKPWPARLALAIESRNPEPESEYRVEGGVQEALKLELLEVNGARVIETSPGMSVQFTGEAWAYAGQMSLPDYLPNGFGLRAVGELAGGHLGILVTTLDGRLALSPESVVKDQGAFEVLIPPTWQGPGLLVFRTTSRQPLSFMLKTIEVVDVATSPVDPTPLSEMGAERLADLLNVDSQQPWLPFPLQNIARVTPTKLARHLKIPTLVEDGDFSVFDDPKDRVMERDDAHILQWLYSNLRPTAHLEFGTWEGFGTLLCLGSTDAHVWTVNIPGGERNQGATNYIQSREPFHPSNPRAAESGEPTDAESAIGWMYRATQQQDRVTQVLLDSRVLPLDIGPACGFDTILIDGSHERDVVRHDQKFALARRSRSGVIIWHDFSLAPEVVAAQPASRGVIAAVADDIVDLHADLELFWIVDSMLLVGVPRIWNIS